MNEFSTLMDRSGLSETEAADHLGYSARQIFRWKSGEVMPKPVVLNALRTHIGVPLATSQAAFRFIDLFAGIGGLRRGFDAIGGECVFTSEWDRFSAETYRAN